MTIICDLPLYVHSQSNHPRSVLKNIPRSINDRLSKLSSSEEIFDAAVPPYKQAISNAGYSYKMKCQPPTAVTIRKPWLMTLLLMQNQFSLSVTVRGARNIFVLYPASALSMRMDLWISRELTPVEWSVIPV